MQTNRTKNEQNHSVKIRKETTSLSAGGLKYEFFIAVTETSEAFVNWTYEPIGMITFYDGVYVFTGYLLGKIQFTQTGHRTIEAAEKAATTHGGMLKAWLGILLNDQVLIENRAAQNRSCRPIS